MYSSYPSYSGNALRTLGGQHSLSGPGSAPIQPKGHNVSLSDRMLSGQAHNNPRIGHPTDSVNAKFHLYPVAPPTNFGMQVSIPPPGSVPLQGSVPLKPPEFVQRARGLSRAEAIMGTNTNGRSSTSTKSTEPGSCSETPADSCNPSRAASIVTQAFTSGELPARMGPSSAQMQATYRANAPSAALREPPHVPRWQHPMLPQQGFNRSPYYMLDSMGHPIQVLNNFAHPMSPLERTVSSVPLYPTILPHQLVGPRMYGPGEPQLHRTTSSTEQRGDDKMVVQMRDMGFVSVKYFDMGKFVGRGGALRFFLLGKQIRHEFENVAIKTWESRKEEMAKAGDFPLLQLPQMTHNQRKMFETIPMIRYLAKHLGEYGKDDMEDYLNDVAIERVAYFRDEIMAAIGEYSNNETSNSEVFQHYLSVRESQYGIFEALLAHNQKIRSIRGGPPDSGCWFNGSDPTFPDFALFSCIYDDLRLMEPRQWLKSGEDFVFPQDRSNVLTHFPRVHALYKQIKKLPLIYYWANVSQVPPSPARDVDAETECAVANNSPGSEAESLLESESRRESRERDGHGTSRELESSHDDVTPEKGILNDDTRCRLEPEIEDFCGLRLEGKALGRE